MSRADFADLFLHLLDPSSCHLRLPPRFSGIHSLLDFFFRQHLCVSTDFLIELFLGSLSAKQIFEQALQARSHAPAPNHSYSYRSATMGSTRIARRAGT